MAKSSKRLLAAIGGRRAVVSAAGGVRVEAVGKSARQDGEMHRDTGRRPACVPSGS